MQSNSNRLIVSVAGSGKTTYLVNEALKIKDSRVLITTYTEANEKEIRLKFIEINNIIPVNITIQTWFSFLIQHGVKPYQGSMYQGVIKGMLFVNNASGIQFINKTGIPIPYTEEKNFEKVYFTPNKKIYSDKLAKFVIRCNQESDGAVFLRLGKIFSNIFIDEVQDLAGNDLEILKKLFGTKISTTLVGDPRQVTYLTHSEKLNTNYKNGRIKDFITEKCKGLCIVDEVTLKNSHRNHKYICDFSSRLYPNLPVSFPCDCNKCRNSLITHTGIFLVRNSDIPIYQKRFNPTVLRYSMAREPEWNFGKSKGLGFNNVLIFPTQGFLTYLKDGELTKIKKKKGKTTVEDAFDIAKFYVAITRARYSVAIACDYDNDQYIDGLKKWMPLHD